MRIQPFDFSINLMRSILWQYDGAENAVALARNDQSWINTSYADFWTNWYRDVFDVDTANSFGLSVWARILGLRLEIDAQRNVTSVWGFGVNNKNFENGGFGRASDEVISLDTGSARTLIKLRWFQLTMRPTVPNINAALEDVFGAGAAFVFDSYDMTMTYIFNSEPDYRLRRLLENTEILPRPSTVKVGWMVRYRPSWGFGVHHLNFENGNFGA